MGNTQSQSPLPKPIQKIPRKIKLLAVPSLREHPKDSGYKSGSAASSAGTASKGPRANDQKAVSLSPCTTRHRHPACRVTVALPPRHWSWSLLPSSHHPAASGLQPRARCGALTIAARTTSPGVAAGLLPPCTDRPTWSICTCPHESGPPCTNHCQGLQPRARCGTHHHHSDNISRLSSRLTAPLHRPALHGLFAPIHTNRGLLAPTTPKGHNQGARRGALTIAARITSPGATFGLLAPCTDCPAQSVCARPHESGHPRADRCQVLQPRARRGALTIAARTTSPAAAADLLPPYIDCPTRSVHTHPHESGPHRTAPMGRRRMGRMCTMRTCIRFPAKRHMYNYDSYVHFLFCWK